MLNKIKTFFRELFSMDSFASGLFGIAFGLVCLFVFHYFWDDPFKYLRIFMYGIGVLLSVFITGYVMNKTMDNDDN